MNKSVTNNIIRTGNKAAGQTVKASGTAKAGNKAAGRTKLKLASGSGRQSNYPLDWWKEGYNKIKHNRIENLNCATLQRTLEALAGLFLAIIRCEKCWDSLWEKHWMSWVNDASPSPFDPFDCLKSDFGYMPDIGSCAVTHMAIESKLFTYPVGLCSNLITPKKEMPLWEGNCSRRFKAWYCDYCQTL